MTEALRFAKRFALLASVLCLLSACALRQAPVRREAYMLNTLCAVTVYSERDAAHLDDLFAYGRMLEGLLSATVANSDVDKLNQNPGVEIAIAAETKEVLEKAIGYAALSQGRFDVTAGRLTALWRFDAAPPRLPDSLALSEALATVGIDQLRLTPNGAVLEGGMLDLGGIAKGYIADRLRDFLSERGVESALIDLGGDITLLGQKPDGSAFRIAVARPFTDHAERVGELLLGDVCIATSGIDRRGFDLDGRRYHHILDLSTGHPAETGLQSVSVVCKAAADADALATVLFLLGIEEGMALVEELEGIEALFVAADGGLLASSGLTEKYFFEESGTN